MLQKLISNLSISLWSSEWIPPKYDTRTWATNARVNKVKNTVALFASDMWSTNRARKPELLLRNEDDFFVPTHKMTSVKRFPHLLLPKIWNESPDLERNPIKLNFWGMLKLSYTMQLYSNCVSPTSVPLPAPSLFHGAKVSNTIAETDWWGPLE